MKKRIMATLAVAVGTLALGFQQGLNAMPGDSTFKNAVAFLRPTQGRSVKGRVIFTQEKGFVHVKGQLTGLKPGAHGFHIHEYGDCGSPDGKSAGGHFNPEGVSHGSPQDSLHHMGDLGNITADRAGNAEIDAKTMFLSLHGDKSIVGRAVIVHADPDDMKSQPSGAAGDRVACGVIGIIAGGK